MDSRSIQWLARHARRLGADSAIWLPSSGPVVAWPAPLVRPLVHEVDWGQVERLGPSRVVRAGSWVRRSPRAQQASRRWLWATCEERAAEGAAPGSCSKLGLGTPARGGVQPFEGLPDGALASLAEAAQAQLGALVGEGQGPGGSSSSSLDSLGLQAAGLLHDLRNQLTLTSLVAGRAQAALGEEGELSKELLGEVETLLGDARSVCAGALAGAPGPIQRIPVRQLLQQEAQAAITTAHAKNPRAARPRVRCDGSLHLLTREPPLRRLVRNLVLNSIQASPNRSHVSISARLDRGGRLQLLVEDEGRGMDQESLERLFAAGHSESGSTGLGTASLYTCLRDLEAELQVHSALGSGTRVRIQLPSLESLGPELLLLDPDPERGSRRAKSLTERGWQVQLRRQPGRVLEDLGRRAPRLLLVARGAAGELSRELRHRAAAAGVPLRVLSAATEPVPAWNKPPAADPVPLVGT